MTSRVVTVREEERVQDALDLMAQNGISWLPVVDRVERCVGVISHTDLISLANEMDEDSAPRDDGWMSILSGGVRLADVTNERISDVMSDAVITVGPDEPVNRIAELMTEHHVHHVPVCGAEDRLLGVVSTMDILRLVRNMS
jgi:CBS domain-containing protein